MEDLYGEPNKRAEAATGSYSAACDFSQYIYYVLVAKNHQKIRSGCLVQEFFFVDVFYSVNHGYRAATLKKNSLWLLSFYIVVASYCYFKKVSRTVDTALYFLSN